MVYPFLNNSTNVSSVTSAGASVVFLDADNNRLDIDATMREVKKYRNRISRFPVEDGTEVSDNVIKMNREFEITGVISQTPIIPGQLQLTANTSSATEINDDVFGKLTSLGLNTNTTAFIPPEIQYITNVSDAQDFLDNLRDEASLFSIQYRSLTKNNTRQIVEQFDNCVIRDLQYTSDVATGEDLYFTASIEQIVIVTSQTVTVKTQNKPVSDRANTQKNKGNVTPTSPAPAPDPAGSDLYNQFFNN